VVLGAAVLAVVLEAAADRPARLALILDDLGNSLELGRTALALPGAVTYAVLPHTPHGPVLAAEAHRTGREVMLHLPMEARGHACPGAGTLELGQDQDRLRGVLLRNLAAVPHVVGVNNHMGSRLTRHPEPMRWLMAELRVRGLYFVDSRTTGGSVAEAVAREAGVAVTRRDVFLDPAPGSDTVRRQWRHLLEWVRRSGRAVGIGHPRAATLEVLAAELPRLEARGIVLVPVSRLVQPPQRQQTWPVSWSPSPPVVKSSKP
jgi:polysaccharide deacetylase 2 family uncharacterized protein YibQ